MALINRDELAVAPYVIDGTFPTNPDAAPAAVLIPLVGMPTDGQVPTYDAALGYHVPGPNGVPATATQVWMPLTTVVGGVPELVWDGGDSLIPTLVTL